MGDCSYCSREAAVRNHRIGRMRLPMKNITQPLVIAPTPANLQMLASLDPDRQFFFSKFLVGLGSTGDFSRRSRCIRNAAESRQRMEPRHRRRFDWDGAAAQPADAVLMCRAAEYPLVRSVPARKESRGERTWHRYVF